MKYFFLIKIIDSPSSTFVLHCDQNSAIRQQFIFSLQLIIPDMTYTIFLSDENIILLTNVQSYLLQSR